MGYFSLLFLIREVYYGWCLRYFHSSGASFAFLFHFLHLGRAMFYGSYFYNPNTCLRENPIFPFHFSKRFLWFHSNSLSISSSNSFRDLFFLTSRQCIRSLCITYSFTYSY